MAKQGARNLILLSRSGAKSIDAARLVHDLEDQGVCVATPMVDIGDIDSLKRELNTLQHMPAVRGCIQATVVLKVRTICVDICHGTLHELISEKDDFFENMSYEDWVASTRSKATGSRNLDAVLPDVLDFFILLSSLNGIFGGRGRELTPPWFHYIHYMISFMIVHIMRFKVLWLSSLSTIHGMAF